MGTKVSEEHTCNFSGWSVKVNCEVEAIFFQGDKE